MKNNANTVSNPKYGAIDTLNPICFRGTMDARESILEKEVNNISETGRRHSTYGNGLSTLAAAAFIAGEMAGSGVLALPKAMVDIGWVGFPLMVILCCIAGYSGSRLGACWTILEARYPYLQSRKRNPYALIAYHALGRFGSIIVSIAIQITLFGASVVYLLLAAQIIGELLEDILPSVGFCMWYLVIILALIPATWLGSPKDFSFVGIGAILTTVIACLLFFIQIWTDSEIKVGKHKATHDLKELFIPFGTILFAFGGASTFPTIQNDMNEKHKFRRSILIAFIAILLVYLPVTAMGYYVYGDDVTANIAMSISRSPILTIANLLMAIHLIFAFLIIINPVCQELEEICNTPTSFHWRRCLLRTLVMMAMLLVGETIPKFNVLLALVGGSTIALLTFVLPPVCYLKICHQSSSPHFGPINIPLHEKVFLWEIVAVGVLGGSATTYSALLGLFSSQTINIPCFLR